MTRIPQVDDIDGRARVAPEGKSDPLLDALEAACWSDGTCPTPVRCYLDGICKRVREAMETKNGE